ncbi:hypothetical protein B0H10DRAFT_1996373 [Mycena sp. CBHHK59/15]|nr:hypothetical protein B0H10DRAFT_1996373 [Mycena sp. CBHHK59/15]
MRVHPVTHGCLPTTSGLPFCNVLLTVASGSTRVCFPKKCPIDVLGTPNRCPWTAQSMSLNAESSIPRRGLDARILSSGKIKCKGTGGCIAGLKEDLIACGCKRRCLPVRMRLLLPTTICEQWKCEKRGRLRVPCELRGESWVVGGEGRSGQRVRREVASLTFTILARGLLPMLFIVTSSEFGSVQSGRHECPSRRPHSGYPVPKRNKCE